jgi:transposase-like protein
MTKLTPQHVSEMLDAFERAVARGRSRQGTVTTLALRYGVAKGTVNLHLLRNGLDPWEQGRTCGCPSKFSDEESRTALQMRRDGKGWTEICRALNRHRNSVLFHVLTIEVRAESALEAA